MQFSGTPAYMAPEIFKKQAYDSSVDIFAFGALLWELIARKVPFDGLEPISVMERVLAEEELPIPYKCPQYVAQIITTSRHIDPTQRPTFSHIAQTIQLNYLNSK